MGESEKEEYFEILENIGEADDENIDLAQGAISLAALACPGIKTERYYHHLNKIAQQVTERHKALLKEGAADDAATRLAALKHIIVDQHGYEGDSESYDDLQNVNLIRVIDRRKGMPIALSILYIYAAQAQGWDVMALNFPAHVVCRLDKDGERLLFDPFNKCKILQAADLRQLLKTLVSPSAELSADYYEPSTKRDLLIRLQNNIKLRQIEAEDYSGAVETVEVMRRIDPKEYRLLLDAGVLYARTQQPIAAIDSLEKYVDRVPTREERHEALILLRQIRESLN